MNISRRKLPELIFRAALTRTDIFENVVTTTLGTLAVWQPESLVLPAINCRVGPVLTKREKGEEEFSRSYGVFSGVFTGRTVQGNMVVKKKKKDCIAHPKP